MRAGNELTEEPVTLPPSRQAPQWAVDLLPPIGELEEARRQALRHLDGDTSVPVGGLRGLEELLDELDRRDATSAA